MKYTVCEISGRQYLIKPGQVIEVDKLSDEVKILSIDKILLLVNDKLELGRPYLNKRVDFEVLGDIKKPKVRVATYKSKTNYRRIKGQRREVTRIKLAKTVDSSFHRQ